MKKILVLMISILLVVSVFVMAACGNKYVNEDGTPFEVHIPTGASTGVKPSSSSGAEEGGSGGKGSGPIGEYEFKYEAIEDGAAYKVVDNGVYRGEAISIPATYNGKPVKEVGEFAFKQCESLKKITFSENTTVIPSNAFAFCTLLNEINVTDGNAKFKSEGNCLIDKATNTIVLGCNGSVIPEGVVGIGEYAFYGLAEYNVVSIPKGVTNISENAYCYCMAIESIVVDGENGIYTSRNGSSEECDCLIESATHKVILTCRNSMVPDDVESYGSSAFANNEVVEEVTIPNGVPIVDYDMFVGCTSLKTLHIAANVTGIAGYTFRDCRELETITVDPANPVYECVNGCLRRKSDKVVIIGTVGATIPADSSEIEEYAFYARNITSITIHSGVTSIGSQAFHGCVHLQSATFVVTTGWYILDHYQYNEETDTTTPVHLAVESDWLTDNSSAIAFITKIDTRIYRL